MFTKKKRGGAAVAERPQAHQENAVVSVSFPTEGETVTHPNYTFQIAAGKTTESVAVSIDNSDWQPCREALGLWWFDWTGYESGEHEVEARLQTSDGETETSEPRIFDVKLD